MSFNPELPAQDDVWPPGVHEGLVGGGAYYRTRPGKLDCDEEEDMQLRLAQEREIMDEAMSKPDPWEQE